MIKAEMENSLTKTSSCHNIIKVTFLNGKNLKKQVIIYDHECTLDTRVILAREIEAFSELCIHI